METVYQKKDRIPWIDVYKGIAIILVVVGHATGIFNAYIYQFHMAAFFLVSGYAMKKERSLSSELVAVCYKLLLPMVVLFLIGTVVMFVENRLNIYDYLYADNLPYVGVVFKLKQFFLHGNNYVWWMGACWFLLVLSGIRVMWRVLLKLFGDLHLICLLVGSMAMYAGGILLNNYGIQPTIWLFSVNMILIAQFYYFCGYVLKETRLLVRVKDCRWKTGVYIAVVMVSLAVMYWLQLQHVTVNFVDQNFGNGFLALIAGLNGSFFLWAVSSLLAEWTPVRRPLTYLGINSLGILFFHFSMFKVGYLLLIALKIAPLAYLKNFVNDPATVAGSQFWWVSALTGLLLSVWLWYFLLKIRPVRICLGQDQKTSQWLSDWVTRQKKQLAAIFSKDGDIGAKLYKTGAFAHRYAWQWIILALLAVCVGYPIVHSGFILNDELQFSIKRLGGFWPMIWNCVRSEVSSGRVARFMAGVFLPLSFLFRDTFTSRLVQYAYLLLGSCSLYWFVKKLWRDKRTALLSSIFFLCLLPVTFEHAVPNAFNGLCVIPLSILFCSFAFYIQWLDTGRKSYRNASVLLFAIASLSYEFIVMYVLVFPILYVVRRRTEPSLIKNLIRNNIAFAVVFVAFFALLFVAPKLATSQYAGASIGFVSLLSSARIIKTLFLSCIPGYFLLNSKYIFLYANYADAAETRRSVDYAKLLLQNALHDPRTVCMVVGLFLLLIWVLAGASQKKKCSLWPMLICGAYMIIPSVPNAISKMYQGAVSGLFFTSLPVSIFLYAACIIGIAYYIRFVAQRGLLYRVIMVVCVCALVAPIQTMNTTFTNVHHADFQRLELAQAFVKDDDIGKVLLQDRSVAAPELYETRNLLAVHDSFWKDFLRAYGIEGTDFHKGNGTYDCSLHYQMDDQTLVYQAGDDLILYSNGRIPENTPIRLYDGSLVALQNVGEALIRQAPFVYRYSVDSLQTDAKLG